MKDSLKKTEPVPLSFDYRGQQYTGTAEPLSSSCKEEDCYEYHVTLNEKQLGTIYRGHDDHWSMKDVADADLVAAIGEQIMLWHAA